MPIPRVNIGLMLPMVCYNYPFKSGEERRFEGEKEVTVLELDNATSGYNGQAVLHNISLKLQEPSIYVVLGPNGAGKTTLFRTIAGILEPYNGKILLDGENTTISRKARTRISYLSPIQCHARRDDCVQCAQILLRNRGW